MLPNHRLRRGKASPKTSRNNKKSKHGGEVTKSFSLNGSDPLPAAMNYVPSNQIYKTSQSYLAGASLTSSTTVPTYVSFYFAISSVDQITSLAAVFDQYRIDEIELWWIPRTIAGLTNPGQVLSVVDYDDASALTTIAQASDYDNCLTTSAYSGHYRRFRPHIALAAFAGAFTSYENSGPQWIDFASTAVQHYGLKFAVTAQSTASIFDVNIRYHISMRNVR